jgi:predicted nucleotidyltransferase
VKPIDIEPRDLETVREILARHVPEYEVRAFGSRVRHTARRTSDLDLAVMTDVPLDSRRRGDLRDDFTESDLPFKVDVVDWASTDGSFRKIIEEVYAVVQVAGSLKSTISLK